VSLIVLLFGSLAGMALLVTATPASAQSSQRILPGTFRLVESESGPFNYYRVMREGKNVFLRSSYAPPLKTAVMGWQTPEADRERIRKVAWTWRARTLPKGGDECADGKGDSAAVVYLTFKRTLRYYTLKYVWSAVGIRGKVCDKKRNPFVAQDTIILESGPSSGGFRSVEIDLAREFRRHFADGDASADVPPFMGIGLMSDGDDTETESSADFGPFLVTHSA
jgi:hypothetical protein